MSESKKNLDPNDPSYYAPPRARERDNTLASPENERPSLPAQRRLDDPFSSLRADTQSDAFAQAIAKMLREQRETEFAGTPTALQRRSSLHLVGKLAGAIASAALVALLYVEVFSSDDRLGLASLLRPREMITSPAPHRRASTLVVRNHSGLVNEPLELGVSVDAADPGATVTVRGMPAEASLTAGTPLSLNEWRIPAEQISEAKVIPPTGFVGEMNLSAELHNSDGTALVTSFLQLAWRALPVAAAPAVSSTAMASAVPGPNPLPPTLPSAPILSPPSAAVDAAPAQPPAETPRQLSPNEIAGLVRRAEELLATGDVKAARTLLMRAADAHDARAALFLAKTFDPITSRQLSASESGPDLAQARNWYQRAREWGSPEAQHQLDALASYQR
ncbi:hypothetical protein [Bradyrhizobium sp.]|uniref:hypothetical protein n=1 Tax=Bradyrhizobium sp. TaxID=376 RepID=UPI003C3FFDF2